MLAKFSFGGRGGELGARQQFYEVLRFSWYFLITIQVFFFFFLVCALSPPIGENAVGLSFCKSCMIQGKNSYLKYIQIKDSLRSKYKSVKLSIYGLNII